jgi:hypothetical protein
MVNVAPMPMWQTENDGAAARRTSTKASRRKGRVFISRYSVGFCWAFDKDRWTSPDYLTEWLPRVAKAARVSTSPSRWCARRDQWGGDGEVLYRPKGGHDGRARQPGDPAEAFDAALPHGIMIPVRI